MEIDPIILLKDKINLIKKKIENENDPSKLNSLKLKLNSCTGQLIFYEKLKSENLEQSKQLESKNLKLKTLESDNLKLESELQDYLENNLQVSHLIKNGEVSFVPHTTSETDSKHGECTTIDASFTLLDNPYCDENLFKHTTSKVWWNHKNRNYTVSNEAQTISVFQDLLQDIICLCGFSDSMDIIIEHGITNMVPDFMLVSKNDVPKGVIEIKRAPSKELTDKKDRKISGQIFDYMCLLKYFHNLKQVIGITSTYLESEILWLQEDPLINENNINNIKENISKNKSKINPQSVPTKLSKTFVPKLRNSKKTSRSPSGLVTNRIDRKVYKSQVIAQNDPDYVKTLCSVVQRMYYSETNPEEGSNSRHYIQINSTSWFWVKLEQEIIPNYSQLLDIDTENPPDLENPLLLEDLGSGGDGKCWLAFNLDSDVFVIKFFKDETNAEIEKFFWKEIWGINTHVTVLNKKRSLIIPYFKILTDEDWNDDRVFKLVKESCKIFSQKGYFHKDLSQRHVAKYTESDKIKIVFIDL